MTDQNLEEQDFKNADELNRQRQIFKRKPKSARDLINTVVIKRGIAAEKSNNEIGRIWCNVVGENISNQTRPGSLKRGVLEVVVGSSSLMQQLGFFKDDYLEQINLKLKKSEIKDLRFRLGRID